jgi:hypothetical protein
MVELISAIRVIGTCPLAIAARRGVVIRVDRLVAGRLVEDDLQIAQGSESSWR